jgi:hypothetical protein
MVRSPGSRIFVGADFRGAEAERYLMQIKFGWERTSKINLDFFFANRKPQPNAAAQKLCAIVSFREVEMLARHLFGVCAVVLSTLANAPATAQDRPQDYPAP